MGKKQDKHVVTLKAAYIAAGDTIFAALLVSAISAFNKPKPGAGVGPKDAITQTVSGSGTAVINTGSGTANVQK